MICHGFDGCFVLICHGFIGIVPVCLWQAALRRIELFRFGVTRLPQFVMGRSGRTDPERRKPQKGKSQKGQKAQKGAERDFLGRFRPKKIGERRGGSTGG